MNRARYEELVTKAVDELLTTEERDELEAHLDNNPELRAELDDFVDLKGTMDAMTKRILDDAQINPPRPDEAERRANKLSFVLIIVGAVSMAGYTIARLWSDDRMPMPVKIGAGAIGCGVILLFVFVMRRRWLSEGRDPYEKVDQ